MKRSSFVLTTLVLLLNLGARISVAATVDHLPKEQQAQADHDETLPALRGKSRALTATPPRRRALFAPATQNPWSTAWRAIRHLSNSCTSVDKYLALVEMGSSIVEEAVDFSADVQKILTDPVKMGTTDISEILERYLDFLDATANDGLNGLNKCWAIQGVYATLNKALQGALTDAAAVNMAPSGVTVANVGAQAVLDLNEASISASEDFLEYIHGAGLDGLYLESAQSQRDAVLKMVRVWRKSAKYMREAVTAAKGNSDGWEDTRAGLGDYIQVVKDIV